jgi:hypothetical protein
MLQVRFVFCNPQNSSVGVQQATPRACKIQAILPSCRTPGAVDSPSALKPARAPAGNVDCRVEPVSCTCATQWTGAQ